MNELGRKREPFFFCIDFEMLKPFVIPLDEIDPSILLFHFPAKTNFSAQTQKHREINLVKKPIAFTEYQQAFQKVRQELRHGNSYLLNLTFPTEIDVNASLPEIFSMADAPYKVWYRDEFTFFSPETFVRIRNGKIYTHPMKGTIDASTENAENKLLKDKKELAEHYTIVDLLRNDLAMISANVKVDRFRYLSYIKTHEKQLIQMSSEISGEPGKNFHQRLGDLIFTLLPAGSVSGAPKQKTVEIIRAVEKNDRGWFTGVCGIFDGNELDSCVMIRFIEKKNGRHFYRSGGGITVNSSAKKEYRELIDKVYVPVA